MKIITVTVALIEEIPNGGGVSSIKDYQEWLCVMWENTGIRPTITSYKVTDVKEPYAN